VSGAVHQILVVNAGSSSLRLRVLDEDDAVTADAHLERPGDDEAAIASFLDALDRPPDAVGHRVVHGGTSLPGAIQVDDAVEAQIEALAPLAPLHQPQALDGIRQLRSLLPTAPAVACFDTAFHRTMPPAASTYALPAAWRERWDLRRFGFHGLSHAYASRRAIELLAARGAAPAGREPRIVTCHLGAGASLCATLGGVSVDTTMGFTPLEGLVMATRSGSVDPGLVLWLVLHGGLEAAEVERALRQDAGLAGLSGGSGDLRDVLRRRGSGDPAAGLAFDVYVHRLTSAVGAMAASLGGLDALVFTGGVGEHEPELRREVVGRLAFLGLAVDEEAGRGGDVGGDDDVTAAGATAAVFVVEAREDLEIARLVRSVVDSGRRHPPPDDN
jgi:acetate kinase